MIGGSARNCPEIQSRVPFFSQRSKALNISVYIPLTTSNTSRTVQRAALGKPLGHLD